MLVLNEIRLSFVIQEISAHIRMKIFEIAYEFVIIEIMFEIFFVKLAKILYW